MSHDMKTGREVLAEIVLDEKTSPIGVLGATVAFVRTFGNESEKRIAQAVHEAIRSVNLETRA